MTYQEFLRRVQDRAGLSSTEETGRIVAATFEALRESLTGGGVDALPQEIRQLLPVELIGAAGASETANPQLVGETRSESGGESTAESGQ